MKINNVDDVTLNQKKKTHEEGRKKRGEKEAVRKGKNLIEDTKQESSDI